MTLKAKIAKIGAVAAAGTALAVLGSGSAFAGTNGQQIAVHNSDATINSVYIQGDNQNGELTAHCFNTPQGDTYISDWWWVETTDFFVYTGPCDSSGNPTGDRLFNNTVDVPRNQDSDWTWLNF
ncbi:hypothetical protein AV521_33995 [Streptomyces sp. IMTB 2501]|uniref:hypothetical protein n=1 Tax=Streptomyces sp. IMTB 2501 TaxID=1776340 RepID=UPI00096C4C2D|nr:hypothetical protein [Streptomyces sp. IMTB 2501]OLZ64966.1 hypothetical protein AV521_33995 [Streptomyces sp. IMTB 2501]